MHERIVAERKAVAINRIAAAVVVLGGTDTQVIPLNRDPAIRELLMLEYLARLLESLGTPYVSKAEPLPASSKSKSDLGEGLRVESVPVAPIPAKVKR